MTNVVVAPGATSSGLSLGFNDTLTVSSGGTVTGSSFQDAAIVIQSGGAAVHDSLTDFAYEQVFGSDSLSFVGNGAEMVVFPGGVAKYVHAAAGGELFVYGAGTTNSSDAITDSAFVDLGGVMSVTNDGQAVATTVATGGEMVVSSGIATDSYISGGNETVAGAGSVDTGAIVFSGGVLLAVSGGLCSGAAAFGGGVVVVESGGELQSATLGSGGADIISANALAVQTTVEAGGEEEVSGGTVLQTTLSGGLQIVDGGVGATGGAAGTIVSAGAEQLVVSSGLGQATSVLGGGSAAVETGGDLNQTTVSSGGVVIERYFGSSTNTNLMAGGTDLVESGGLAILAQVAGSQQVSGGETSATTVVAGGQETVLSGGLASGTVISSGGTLTISSGGLADGAKVVAGGSLIVDGTLSTDATFTVAGHLALGGAVAGPRTLDGTGTLALIGGGSTVGAGAVLSIAHLTQGDATLTAAASFAYGGTWTQTKGWISVDLFKTLTLTGTGDRFSGTLNGSGTVDFAGGSDTLSGTRLLVTSAVVDGARVTLAGAIDLDTNLTVTSPDLTIAAQGATLSGGGNLLLSNLASNRIVGADASATLTNVDDDIEGAGDLGGGSMVLDNQGGIAGYTNLALVIDTGANAITNAGEIQSDGAGGVTIKSALDNTGILDASVGTLTLDGAVTGAGSVRIDGGTADFLAAFSQTVTFDSTSGVLELAKSQAYAGAITGFSLTGGTSLDLRDIGFTSGKTKATFVENGAKTQGVLTVTNGAETALITLVGNFSGSTFTTSSDGHGGTTVVDPHKSPAAVAPRRSDAVLPFIAAMAGFDTGASRWVPTAESGRSSPHPLAAAHLN